MPQNVGSVTATLNLDTRKAAAAYRRFEQQVSRSSRRDNLFSGISADARDFESSLGKATNRVVAFGAAAAVFTTLAKAASSFAESIVEVDSSLAKINVNLNQSGSELKKFGSDLFNVARQTGQTFDTAAKAAEELARQGLGAGETIERLQKALILSRIAGIDAGEAVNTLTAAINSFNEEALTASEVVNKFAAVDTKFAVSSKDLAEAVARVGSTAQSAGVGINELIGLVTSLQQTTQRGGATIGNGLKTIFTRIQAAPETVNALQGIGVAIKNTDGSLRDAISVLKDYAVARERVGEVERASLDRTVAGGFQINVLKALLADITKQYSFYGEAVKTATNATDEAIVKNEKLNKTLESLINSTGVSIKQFFASVGSQDVGPLLNLLLSGFERVRQFFSGDSGNDLGKTLGQGLLKGLSSVISGPALVALFYVIGNAVRKVVATIATEARTLLTINNTELARTTIQKQINFLLTNATAQEKAQYELATATLAKKEQLLAIQARINQEVTGGTSLVNSFLRPSVLGGQRPDKALGRGVRIPTFADPISSAIAREQAASGLPPGQIYIDKDARVANFANPMGLLVANRRDEPLGGFQGVNRVISQGGNPKIGSIPGFAAPPFNRNSLRGSGGQFIAQADVDALNSFFASLKGLDRSRIKDAAKGLRDLTQSLSDSSRKIVNARYASLISAAKRAEGRVFLNGTGTPPNEPRPFDDPKQGQFPDDGGHAERFNRRSEGKFQYRRPIGPSNFQFETYQDAAYNIKLEARAKKLFKAYERGAIARRVKQADASRRQQRLANGTLAASFALPLIGGFAEPGLNALGIQTGGGTLGGAAAGALQYGSQFAGIGALTGNPAIAAAAGGIGILVGAFSKLSKSTEELAAGFDQAASDRSKESDAISRALSLREQLKEAEQNGASPAVLRKLNESLIDASNQVGSKRGQAVLGATTDAGREAAQRDVDRENAIKASRDKIFALLSGNAKGNLSTAIREGLNTDFVSGLSAADKRTLGEAGSGNFGRSFSSTGRSDKDVIADIKKNDEEFARVRADFLKAFGPFVEGIDVTKDNFGELAQATTKAINQFNKITADVNNRKNPANGRLNFGSFLGAPDSASYFGASAASRRPTNRSQRSAADYAFFTEFSSNGGVSQEVLDSNPEFQKARLGIQGNNIAEGALSFLEGAGRKRGRFTDSRGDPNFGSIERELGFIENSGVRDSGKARYIRRTLEERRKSAGDLGLNAPGYVEGVSGYIPGAAYGTTGKAGGASYINRSTVQATIAAQNDPNNTGRFNTPFYTMGALQKRNRAVGAVSDPFTLTQGASASAPSTAPADYANQATKASKDIDSYLKIAADAKIAAEASVAALQQTLNIMVTVAGAGDPDTLAAIQASIQTLFDRQSAASGKPNPPTVPVSSPGYDSRKGIPAKLQ